MRANHCEKAIALTTFAQSRVVAGDRKRLLENALAEAQQATAYEREWLEYCARHVGHLLSYREVDVLEERYLPQGYPMKVLFDDRLIEPAKSPPTPVLLKVTDSSVVLRIPKFVLKTMEPNDAMSPDSYVRYEYDLVAKEDEPGSPGSGARDDSREVEVTYDSPTRSIACVTNLRPNSKYSFYISVKDKEGQKAQRSQKSLSGVLCAFPTYIPSVFFFIAKVAFHSGLHALVRTAVLEGVRDVLHLRVEPEAFLNYRQDPLAKYSLNHAVVDQVSLIDLQPWPRHSCCFAGPKSATSKCGSRASGSRPW